MLKSCEIMKRMGPEENMMADKKYASVRGIVTEYEMGFAKMAEFSKIRVRIEHVNGMIKVFGALSGTWRHGEEKHLIVFKFVCNVINLSILNGHKCSPTE
jgi:hypothetical protein